MTRPRIRPAASVPEGRDDAGADSPRAGQGVGERSPGRRFPFFLAAVSALGAALVLARQAAYGPGLLWDSINYLAVARNLLAGEGFVNFDGTPYTVWPPLYPLLLAASGLVGGADPLRVAGLLGASCFGLTVFVVGRYLGPRLESPLLRVWTPAVLALSLPLADLSRYALAGPVFVLFLTLALVATDSYLAAPRPSRLLGAALWTALAWQARYIGAAAPLVIGLWLLLHRGLPLRTRLGRAALFSAVVGIPMGLWLLRNTVLVGRLTGHPPPLAWDAGRTLRELLEGFGGWVAFDLLSPLLPLALGAAILLPLGAGLLAGGAASPAGGTAPHLAGSRRSAALFGSFALGYLILLVLSTSMNEIWVNDRYLAPVFVPLLVAGALSLDRFLRRERRRRSSGPRPAPALPGPVARGLAAGAGRAPTLRTALVGGALSLWAAGQIAPTADAIARVNSEQVTGGFQGPPWADFETLRFLREEAAPESVFHSNLPILVYLHTDGRGTYRSLPATADSTHRITGPAWTPGLDPQERLARWLPEVPEGSLVVWLRDHPATTARFHSYGRPGLAALPELLPVAEFVDGAVFRVSREAGREPPDRFTAAFAAIASGEAGTPAARAAFDLYLGEYLGGAALTYFRAPCREEELEADFFLHFYPAAVPPAAGTARRGGAAGFDNLDFRFAELGVRREDRCVAVVPLPRGEFARLRTGQWVPGAGESWSVEIPP